MIQTLEGCSIVKDNSMALDDAMSANLNVRCLSLNLTLIFNKPRNNKLQFKKDLNNLVESFSLESIPHILRADFNIEISKQNILINTLIQLT